MRRLSWRAGWALTACVAATAPGRGDDSAVNDPAAPTHQQGVVIAINADGLSTATAQCFCLSADQRLLVGCTGSANELRFFDADGKHVRTATLAVSPEAINVTPTGEILVAGGGKLLRLSAEGEELAQVDSPHAAGVEVDKQKLREEVLAQHKASAAMWAEQSKAYVQVIEQVEKRLAAHDERVARLRDEARELMLDEALEASLASSSATAAAADSSPGKLRGVALQIRSAKKRRETYERQIAAYRDSKKQWDELAAQQQEPQELTEQQIDERIAASMAARIRVASISATKDDVFLACSAPVGYGYNVWRLAADLKEGKQIVDGLSGCCGQMDVQASEAGVFVAENSRHRVCRYDADGKLETTWGKSARSGVEGFGSCCNPMNLAFGSDGSVYTAEDTNGRIKRYSPDGKLLAVVGAADLVPGCKKVAIGVALQGDRVYMLDATRNQIVRLDRQRPDPTEPIVDEQVASGSVAGGLFRALGFGN